MANKVTVTPWNGSEELPDLFADIPHRIYANDPNWIPEARSNLRKQFSAENPYFQSNQACIFCNESLRIAGFFNPSIRIDDQPAAFFGFWETTNNEQANEDAFSAIEEWARQQGATVIYGPINFSTFNDYRLRIDSFDHPQMIGEPYNPKYYLSLMENLGYSIRYKYLTSCCTSQNLAAAGRAKLPECEAAAKNAGLEIKPLSPQFWMDNLDQLYPIIDNIFAENFAYSKISLEQFRAACGEKFANKFCPISSNVVVKQDRIVAFHLFYPDYSPLVTQANPTPIPPDQINYQDHFKLLPEPRTLLGKTIGVDPEFRSLGLFYYGGFHGVIQAEDLYQYGYGAMVREDNRSSAISKFATHSYHYGLFTKAL